MDKDRDTVHRHEASMDTCPDCIAELQAERYPSLDPTGVVRRGRKRRVVATHPNPVFAQVYNHETGVLRWYEVDQASLISLLDTDLTEALD